MAPRGMGLPTGPTRSSLGHFSPEPARSREVVAWCREILGGNGIVVDYGVAKFFADMEAIYSFEGTREMNSLIVGRAITGIQAFA